MYPYHADEEVLRRKVRRVGTDEKASGTADRHAEALVSNGVLERGGVNVLERTTQDLPRAAKAKVEGRTAPDPGAREDLKEREVHPLEHVYEGLPHGAGAKGGTREEEARLGLAIHVDRLVGGDGLLRGVEGRVAHEDAHGVAEAGRECERDRVGGVAKVVFSQDARGLPSEPCRENLRHGDLGGDLESVCEAGQWLSRCGGFLLLRREVHGRGLEVERRAPSRRIRVYLSHVLVLDAALCRGGDRRHEPALMLEKLPPSRGERSSACDSGRGRENHVAVNLSDERFVSTVPPAIILQ